MDTGDTTTGQPRAGVIAFAGAATATLLERSRSTGASVGWDDIVGHEAAKRELRVVAAQVSRHSVAERLGLTLVSGVLITGPAGSGKTLLAKALAGAVDRAVYVIPSAEATAVTVREVYEALAAEPCVVVWDEADVLLQSRRRSGEDDRKTVAAFCSALDGVSPIQGPITVCLTAEPEWTLDDSALRAGRLTTHISLLPPSRGERLRLWKAVRGPCSGSRLARPRARHRPHRRYDRRGHRVPRDDRTRLIAGRRHRRPPAGPTRRGHPQAEPRRGAATASTAPYPARRDPRSGARDLRGRDLGTLIPRLRHRERGRRRRGATSLDDAFIELLDMDCSSIRQRIAWSVAGMVAEELIYGPTATSTGSGGDLSEATSLIRRLVTNLGGSATVGPVDVSVVERGSESDRGSEAMRSVVWAEIQGESVAALAAAQSTLGSRTAELERFAGRLVEANDLTLSGDALAAAVAGLAESGQ